MDAILYQFDLTAIDTDALLPQAAAALEKHTELKSRQKYPAMWARTDRTRSAAKLEGDIPRKIVSVICLALGIFLLVPGLVKPKELAAPLFAGILGIVTGVWGLARHRMAQGLQRRQTKGFKKAAAQLLAGKDALETGRYTVQFGSDGFAVADSVDGDRMDVTYDLLECVICTPDTVVLFYDGKALLLPKWDLSLGDAAGFYEFAAEKAALCAMID